MSVLNHLNAGYPILAVETFDDSRILAELRGADRPPMTFSASMILVDVDGSASQATWQRAFEAAAANPESVLIVRDVNHVLANPPIYRALLDCSERLKSNGSTIILAAPNFGTLPPELIHVAPVIRQPLPTREELKPALAVVCESVNVEASEAEAAALLNAAAGLTLAEAENAYALSMVESGRLDPVIVQREKMRTINALGYLNVETPRELSALGGLGNFKNYVESEVLPVADDSQLMVRGVLLCGLPGGGKSLAAKVSASMLAAPLLRLDVSACKGGLVGQSESNIRNACQVIEAVSPCVLWIDEIEKALGGFKSSAKTDGGTTLGMLGHLLTWLQEHNKPIFTIATCNDYNALPTELTRSGRFDERFVIDLPTASEREAIANVHLTRLACQYEKTLPRTIAQRSDGFTGAEIEQVIKSAARRSQRSPTLADITAASGSIKPLSKVNAEAVNEFRQWSKKNLRLANDSEAEPTAKPARKISAGESN